MILKLRNDLLKVGCYFCLSKCGPLLKASISFYLSLEAFGSHLFFLIQYELEREKLHMELEEERKSHRERDQCIQEQQMKIVDLSNPLTSSDFDPNSGQVLLMQSNELLFQVTFVVDAFQSQSFIYSHCF